MRHFSTEDWSDFLRGEAPPQYAGRMQEHLGSSCPECLQGLMETIHILENTRDPARHVSPWNAERSAPFTDDRRRDFLRDTRFARLTFDSAQSPGAVGLRRSAEFSGSTTRQLLYDAAPYAVDIRIEQLQDLPAADLAGQILCSSPANTPQDIRVELMKGKDTICKTLTNTLGEFQIQFQPDEELVLVLRLADETICMNLPDGGK